MQLVSKKILTKKIFDTINNINNKITKFYKLKKLQLVI